MKLLSYQILLILLPLLVQQTNSFSQKVTANKKNQRQPKLNELYAEIVQWRKDLNISNVAISIIENNSNVKTAVYGNLSNWKPALKNMMFEVASVTKVMFSTLVLKKASGKKRL